MNRTAMTRRAAVSGLAMLALSGCSFSFGTEESDPPADERSPEGEDQQEGQNSDEEDSAENEEQAPEDQATEEETTEGEADAGARAPGTVVQIGETFTDPGLGDQFTIVSAMRDNPTEVSPWIPREGGEILYLTFELIPSKSWYGVMDTDGFLMKSGGTIIGSDSAFADEMRAAGLEPFNLASRGEGSTGKVSIAFAIDTRQDSYPAAYVRPKATVTDTGETVPEFVHEFTIPAP